MKRFAWPLALLLLLGACGDGDEGRLDGSWNGKLAVSRKNDRPGVDRVELSIFGHEMTGSDGCSMVKGQVRLEDGHLVVSEWIPPQPCTGYPGKVQSFVHAVLQSRPRVEFSNGGQTMKLTGAPGEMTLERR